MRPFKRLDSKLSEITKDCLNIAQRLDIKGYYNEKNEPKDIRTFKNKLEAFGKLYDSSKHEKTKT